jgi:hypothetical protein
MHQIANTGVANMLTFVQRQLMACTAEDAGSLILLQNNLVVLRKDLQFIPLGYVQHPAQLNGQDNSTQLVNFSNNTCGFHM